ncbi:MAG: hypothetical protein EP315_04825 [Gammaproteobacteria bacterium]|nr:MAG: hypothetical protein EP315_04825 [Gammaproteobacteria bacterium]
MPIIKLLLLAFLLSLLTACQGNSTRVTPDWINNPGDGAVGSAGMHVQGRYYQEELAIARARERLAARYGVEISSIQTIKERIVNDHAYVTSDKEVLQQFKNTVVKAQVRETWHDRARDEVWVWMYPIND